MRKKYQDDDMKKKAKEELDEWDEQGRKNKGKKGENQGPKLTMSVLMQSRASFSNGKALRVDCISAEVLESIPWRALQKIRKAFETRYFGQDKEEIESWLRNIIVLIPNRRTKDRLVEVQTRRICVQSVLAKWYCGCLSTMLEMELRAVGKRDKIWDSIHTFGFKGGRRATEMSTAIRLMTAAARE